MFDFLLYVLTVVWADEVLGRRFSAFCNFQETAASDEIE